MLNDILRLDRYSDYPTDQTFNKVYNIDSKKLLEHIY